MQELPYTREKELAWICLNPNQEQRKGTPLVRVCVGCPPRHWKLKVMEICQREESWHHPHHETATGVAHGGFSLNLQKSAQKKELALHVCQTRE